MIALLTMLGHVEAALNDSFSSTQLATVFLAPPVAAGVIVDRLALTGAAGPLLLTPALPVGCVEGRGNDFLTVSCVEITVGVAVLLALVFAVAVTAGVAIRRVSAALWSQRRGSPPGAREPGERLSTGRLVSLVAAAAVIFVGLNALFVTAIIQTGGSISECDRSSCGPINQFVANHELAVEGAIATLSALLAWLAVIGTRRSRPAPTAAPAPASRARRAPRRP